MTPAEEPAEIVAMTPQGEADVIIDMRPGRKRAEAQREWVAKYWRTIPYDEMAEMLATTNSGVANAARAVGLDWRDAATPAWTVQAQKMRAQGFSRAKVIKALGLGWETMDRWERKLGLAWGPVESWRNENAVHKVDIFEIRVGNTTHAGDVSDPACVRLAARLSGLTEDEVRASRKEVKA